MLSSSLLPLLLLLPPSAPFCPPSYLIYVGAKTIDKSADGGAIEVGHLRLKQCAKCPIVQPPRRPQTGLGVEKAREKYGEGDDDGPSEVH